MEVSWLQLSVSVLVLVCAVLVLLVCVDCRTGGPLVSIAQAEASEEYIPSTEFRVIHPSLRTTDLNPVHSPPSLLPPFSLDPGSQRRQPSYTPTETESNPSYENPGPESLESDMDDPGYIIVLPEGEEAPPTSSRASTPSSDVQNDYVNVKIENPDYLNVEPCNCQQITAKVSTQSDNNDDDDDEDDDSDSDDEGNYVNQPPMINSQAGV